MKQNKNNNISDEKLDDFLSEAYMAALEAKIVAKGGEQRKPPEGMLESILKRAHEEEDREKDKDEDEKNGEVVKIKRRVPKKHLRLLILSAVIMVLIFAMEITGIGSKNFSFYQKKREVSDNNIVVNNGEDLANDADEELAYEDIKSKTGMAVLHLGYKPEGMEYSSSNIYPRHASMLYNYSDRIVTLRQSIGPIEVSGNAKASHDVAIKVENRYIEEEIEVFEELLDSGEYKYYTIISYDKCFYSISGEMNLEEFIKIIENFYIE